MYLTIQSNVLLASFSVHAAAHGIIALLIDIRNFLYIFPTLNVNMRERDRFPLCHSTLVNVAETEVTSMTSLRLGLKLLLYER